MKYYFFPLVFFCSAYAATAQITVYDLNKSLPRNKNSNPQQPTAFNNQLYFIGTDYQHGFELWGIDSATGEFMVDDINPGTSGIIPGLANYNGGGAYDYHPGMMAVQYVNALNKDVLFFAADDGVHGTELYMYDGVNKPSLAKEIVPGPQGLGSVDHLVGAAGYVFFYERFSKIWQYDVNTGNVKLLPR